MLETPHVVVGAAIAAKVTNPLLAVPLAFGSHFVLDMVPHWNPHINTELKRDGKVSSMSKAIIVGDVLAGLAAGIAIANTASVDQVHMFVILMASFAAVLPDVIEGPYFFLGWRHKFLLKWLNFQKAIQVDTTPFIGIFTQIVTVLAALWWIYS